jgi:hypothetical protein
MDHGDKGEEEIASGEKGEEKAALLARCKKDES